MCTGAVAEAVALNEQEYSAWLGSVANCQEESRAAPCHRASAPKSSLVLKLEGEYRSDRIKGQSKSKG